MKSFREERAGIFFCGFLCAIGIGSAGNAKPAAAAPVITPDAIQRLKIVRDGETIMEISREPAEYKMDFDYWEITDPYDETVTLDTEAMYSLFDNISGMYFSKTASVEESEIKETDTWIEVDYAKESEETEHTARILIENTDNEDSYYVAYGDEPDKVYHADAEKLDSILDSNPFDYILKIPALVNIETVESVEMAIGNDQFVMSAEDQKYYFGGKKVKKEAYIELYQALLTVFLDSETAGEENEEPLLKVVFHRNMEEAPEICLEYASCGQDMASLSVNGEKRFLVKKGEVQALIGQIKKVF